MTDKKTHTQIVNQYENTQLMQNEKISAASVILVMMRMMFATLGRLFPKAMGRYAYNLWLTPFRAKMPRRERDCAKKANASFISVEGHKVRVWSWGKGPTVLFIHGWGGRGTQIAAYVECLLEAGFNVLSFDMPAHGESDGKQTNAITVTNAINQIINNIDNLHTVITHSFGGIVFANMYTPTLNLKNAVLICPPADLDTAFNQFTETLNLPKSVENCVAAKLKRNFGDDIFERLSLVKAAKNISQPVLVVHDQQDNVVPYQDGQDVARALKNGDFYGTHSLGHRKILYDKTVMDNVINFMIKTA